MVTRRCNMECGHCSVESNPRLARGPDEAVLVNHLRQAAGAGVRSVLFTGGEPMLRQPLVLQLVKEARKLGLVTAMTSNGFWGKHPEKAEELVSQLARAGLATLNLSFDRYHQAFQGPQPLLNITAATRRHGVRTAIVFTHTREDQDLDQLVAPFRELEGVSFRFYDVQPVGAARRLEPSTLSGRLDGFCQACRYPALSDDGRMTACNGPSYFMPEFSPLIVGNLEKEGLGRLLQRHDQDPILETIRTSGPGALLEELKDFPAFQPRSHYAGTCDVCTHICSDAGAVDWLRQRLQDPAKEAERLAQSLVIQKARRSGTLFRESVNSLGVARALFQRLKGTPDAREVSVLGRADLDWVRTSRVIVESGLAVPMLEALQGAPTWVPHFVTSSLQEHGLKSALRGHLLRRTLETLDSELEELGARGVLLKGAALAISGGRRTTGDIDLWLPEPQAQQLHQQLQLRGALVRGHAARHHLAPLDFGGLLVEIHTRLMPAFWGLPEQEMLAHRISTSLAHLDRLSNEGVFLHAAVHFTKHGFDKGLKTVSDLQWALEQGLDADRLAQWAGRVRLPLAFWAPVQFFQQYLGLQVPGALGGGPQGFRSRLLHRWIAAQFFLTQSGGLERNPFLRVPLYSLLHPCPGSLLSSLAMVLRQPLAAPPASTSWRQQLSEALATARRAWRLG